MKKLDTLSNHQAATLSQPSSTDGSTKMSAPSGSTINIYPTPGMSEAALALAVARHEAFAQNPPIDAWPPTHVGCRAGRPSSVTHESV